MISNKFVLGTAQIGQKYGLNNKQKIFSEYKIKKIIHLIEKNPNIIDTFDTAQNYGQTEKILGKVDISKIKIITKLSLNKKNNYPDYIKNKCLESLKNLKIKKLYGVLIHNCEILKNKNDKEKIVDSLDILKEMKIVKKIGLSIYDPIDLDKYMTKNVIDKIDIIQGPYNFFDRRMKSSGWLKELKKNKIEFHARSIFLQGLLLKDRAYRYKNFNSFIKIWLKFDSIFKNRNIDIYDYLLQFVLDEKNISKIIIGIDNIKQLKSIINFKNRKKKYFYPNIIAPNNLIDPRKW